MSNTSIMSIREIIDTAFGDEHGNVVHFKLIQTVLYLLARQLRLLERRVEVEIGTAFEPSETSLTVTEVKMRAKKKRKLIKVPPGGKGANEVVKGQVGPPKHEPKHEQTSPDKTSTEISSSYKTSTEKSSSYKTSTEISSPNKTSTDKSSSYKTSTEKSSSDKTSTEKSSSDKTSTEKSSSDKTSTQKSSSDKTSTEKSSSDKTSSDKGQSSSDKTSTTKSSTDKSSTIKSSSDKTSTDKSKSTSERTATWTSTEISSSIKEVPEESSDDVRKIKGLNSTQERQSLLDTIEMQRERELRIIRQRADSREEGDKSPVPMASMDSVEVQYEKLLIVERVPKEEVKASRVKSGRTSSSQLSIVTQDQFEELAAIVRQLQTKFTPIAKSTFPENAKLMEELRKGASLTDAMSALQLSARLEAAEKTLEQLASLITDLASRTPGIDMLEDYELEDKESETKVIFGGKSTISSKSKKKSIAGPKKSTSTGSRKISQIAPSRLESEQSVEITPLDRTTSIDTQGDDANKPPRDRVTAEEFDNFMQQLYDEVMKTLTNTINRSNANADNALKISKSLESKIEATLKLDERMDDLEMYVTDYSEQINILDINLTAQMTNYHEELSQMQHDLEIGLEEMAEALANLGGDTTAVTELNEQFTNLQMDLDNSLMKQKKLQDIQDTFGYDIEILWKQVEMLKEVKADRDEVADALRDKAGLSALNGLVYISQFDAVRGDFEKRIGRAYDKFNNQEIIWQKAIDDLIREINEKADTNQVESLRESINSNLEMIRGQLHTMLDIVGEPKAAAISRQLMRDTNCLSCSTPAHMNLIETKKIPALPGFPTRPKTVGAEKDTPKEDGDHTRDKKCYFGLPIPHPRDPRSHVCQRYCGGSHTIVPTALSRAPQGMILTHMREPTTEMGSDGKTYKTDEANKPCLPCNPPKESAYATYIYSCSTHQPKIGDTAPINSNTAIGTLDTMSMTPTDYRISLEANVFAQDTTSVVTPPFFDEG